MKFISLLSENSAYKTADVEHYYPDAVVFYVPGLVQCKPRNPKFQAWQRQRSNALTLPGCWELLRHGWQVAVESGVIAATLCGIHTCAKNAVKFHLYFLKSCSNCSYHFHVVSALTFL